MMGARAHGAEPGDGSRDGMARRRRFLHRDPPTLVHNDFKLDNVMLDEGSPDRIEAVLDWEMTAIGDPLCDLGLTLCYWSSAVVPGTGHEALTAGPGWYTRDEFVAHYADQTGRDLSTLRWHEVLGVFKLAVILQQSYYRLLEGANYPTSG